MLLAWKAVGQPLAAFLFWRFDAEAIGVENIPKSGPILLIGNHQSVFDAILEKASIPRRVRTIIKDDVAAWQLFLIKLLADMFPIKRNSMDLKALRTARQVLESREALCMFPEAHRSKKVIGFHPGVSSLARTVDGVQIVPFGITDAEHLSTTTVLRNLPWGIESERKPKITFGEPFVLPRITHRRPKDQRKADVELMRSKVLEMLPEELAGENSLHVIEHAVSQ